MGRRLRLASVILAALAVAIVSWHLVLMNGLKDRITRTAALGERAAELLGRAPDLPLDRAVRINPFTNEVTVHLEAVDPTYRPLLEVGTERAAAALQDELVSRFDIYSMLVPLRVVLSRTGG